MTEATQTAAAAGSPIDRRALLADIDREVREKRASGELPADFERSLDVAFARFAPVDAVGGDFDTLLAKLEESTTIDTRAPTVSAHRGVAQVKRIVAKAIDWELRHLASQTSGLAHATTRALGLLGARVDELERAAPGAAAQTLAALGGSGGGATWPDGDWATMAVGHLAGRPGRVLHAECGDGAILARLSQAGLDAYGVEPDRELADAAGARVVDIRADTGLDHLRALPSASLSGLILSGCVDRLPPAGLLELADLARSRLVRTGRLMVISHHPAAWAARSSHVVADLSPGRPVHSDTWTRLLNAQGFSGVSVRSGPTPDRQLARMVSDTDEARSFNAAVTWMNDTFFPPDGFAVLATR